MGSSGTPDVDGEAPPGRLSGRGGAGAAAGSTGWRGPLAAIRSSYFLVYAIQGALYPYLSVYLAREHGLAADQIGFILALTALGVVVAPPVVTALAEHRVQGRTLLEILLWLSAGALLAFSFAGGYWWILLAFAVYSLFQEPIKPLLDGIFFTVRRSSTALSRVRFHEVRIWGTAGFMVPGAGLYFLVRWQDSLALVPLLTCGLVVASALAAHRLPARAHPAGKDAPRVPVTRTLRLAAQAMGNRRLAPFLLAMFLLQSTMSAYSAFYPLLATDVVGVSARWLGPLTTLGVLFELGFMAAFGWMVRMAGWRWLMVAGAATSAVRVAALAAFPTVASVVGTQVVHGMVIVVTIVGARTLLDRRVDDGVRHAAQGMYAMLVIGGGRVVGSAAGGLVAGSGLSVLFWSGAAVSAAAAVLLAWTLRGEPGPDRDALRTGRRSGRVGRAAPAAGSPAAAASAGPAAAGSTRTRTGSPPTAGRTGR